MVKIATSVFLLTSLAGAASAQYLYVADSGSSAPGSASLDKLWAFNANDGSLIGSGPLWTDAGLTTMVNSHFVNDKFYVLDSGAANGSVQTRAGLFEYDKNGVYQRTIAGATYGSGATNAANFSDTRSMVIRDGFAYVAMGGNAQAGASAGTIQKIDLLNGTQTLFGTLSGTGASARGLTWIGNELFVTNYIGTTDNRIEKFDANGANLGAVWTGGGSSIRQPVQISQDTDGDLIVSGFSNGGTTAAPTWGVYELSANGVQKNFFRSVSPRGSYRLGNGNFLVAAGSQVRVVNADGVTADQVVYNGSSQNSFFQINPGAPVPEPATMIALGLGIFGLARRKRQK
jgi:hypothetical protein